jgi:hypothetical protein
MYTPELWPWIFWTASAAVVAGETGGAVRGVKRTVRAVDWFPTSSGFAKRPKLDKDEEVTRYFEMNGLPPLAHPHEKYKLIVERDCYVPVFEAVLERAKSILANGWDTTMHVSGNPGIGKSRFYLYSIFHLLLERDIVSTYRLVINFVENYFLYDSEKEEFVLLDNAEVESLRVDSTVFRLIEGNSTKLTGWKGVSVLFASPGMDGLNDFMKVDSFRFYIPVWTFEELKELNSMLVAPLAESTLLERFDMFGGIPRFIFTDVQVYEKGELMQAISCFSALKVLSYVQNTTVREKDYSHRVLCMVPSEDFRTILHLDFLSKYVAEKIVDKVTDDSIHKISEFFVANSGDDSKTTAVVRGRIYELLCHRYVKRGLVLKFRLIASVSKEVDFEVPADVKVVKFAKLDDIPLDLECIAYCQPSSGTFGALDSFVLNIAAKKCYGLQVTLNKNHGIKHQPLLKFLTWLKQMGIESDGFFFGFMVPKDVADDFPKQAILTSSNNVHKKPGYIAEMKQYVVQLDPFKNYEKK